MPPQLTPYDGVLLIDKPAGPTSHDVVDRVRRQFAIRKVGHCGTLDPMATGLLILVLGRATKLQSRLMSDDKTYEGIMRLGIATDSQDADGEVTSERPVPPLTAAQIETVFSGFRGDLHQIPPMVSAVKHQGQALYKLARQGKTVEREPRLIHIYDLRVLGLALPDITFRVACTKGTYVRTLCADMGEQLGCGAHLAQLRRTRSGKFDVAEATTMPAASVNPPGTAQPDHAHPEVDHHPVNILHQLTDLAALAPRACLAVGVFDGVHRGHQSVIRTAIDRAAAASGQAVVLTFDPHPARVLRGDSAPRILTATSHKLRLLGDLGVDACLLITFDEQFARTPAATFIQQLAQALPGLTEICVGERFRFGHDRQGDVALIEQLPGQYGYRATAVPSVTVDGRTVSSTAIREAVNAGNLALAEQLLGRRFSVLGTVETGDRIGRELGFPTANLDPHGEVLPPNGVYAVAAVVGEQTHGGVVNIGTRPTLDLTHPQRRLEVHLLDFDQDIYGSDLEVGFVARLRDEQKFPDRDALRAQIEQDIKAARQLAG